MDSRGRLVRQIIADLSGDRQTAALIDGWAGMGKSTVLDGIAVHGEAAGGRIVLCRGDEPATRIPFGALDNLLVAGSAEASRRASAEAILQRVEDLSDDRPLWLLVDDAHHVDSDSLAVLWRLTAAAQHLPVRLVITRRPHPRREMLDRIAGRAEVGRYDLTALDTTECAQMAAAILGSPIGDRLLGALTQSAGNPLFVGELIAAFSARGQIVTAPDGSADLADGVELSVAGAGSELLGIRLGMLPVTCRVLLDVLAVAGGAARAQEVAELAGQPVVPALGLFEEAVRAGVLRWLPDDRIDFAHDAIRDHVYGSMSAPVRRAMHQEWARTGENDLARNGGVIFHLERAAVPGHADHVVSRLRQMAESMTDGPAAAADVLGQAALLAVTDPALAGQVALDRTSALVKAGQMSKAAEVARLALADRQDPRIEAGLLRLLTLTYSSRGRVREFDRLVGSLEGSRPGHAGVAGRLSAVARWMHVLGGDAAVIADVIAEPPAVQSLTTAVGVLPFLTAAAAYLAAGRGQGAVDAADTAAAAHAGMLDQDNSQSSSVDVWPIYARFYAFGPDSAAAAIAEMQHNSSRDTWQAPFVQFASASVAMSGGRWADAAAEFDAGLDAAADLELGWTSQAVARRARIELGTGDRDAAMNRLRTFVSTGQVEFLGIREVELLLAEAHTGPSEPAAAIGIRAAWSAMAASGLPLGMAVLGPRYLRVALDTGDPELAEMVVTTVGHLNLSGLPALAPAGLLVAAMRDDDPSGAQHAADAYRAIGDRMAAADATAEAALAAARRGETTRAADLAAGAGGEMLDMGAHDSRQLLASRLRLLGVRLGVRGRRDRPTTGWAALTPTEERIAELVAEGRSGPDIAGALYVSPRTVQTHVSSALRKLGLRTRLELARATAGRIQQNATG